MRNTLRHLVSLPGYMRAFHANHRALAHEYVLHEPITARRAKLYALRDLLTSRDNPFILSDLACYDLQMREHISHT